jgi:energy-coupling factor transporter ATP-binding protein EcfA2
MKQLIVITGSKGSGKSTAAATIAPPSEADKVFVIDTENSMSDIVDQIQFGQYVRAYERMKLDATMLESIAKGDLPWVSDSQRGAMADYYHWFITMLKDRLVEDKYKYLVIDTVEPLEMAFTAAIQANPKAFGWSGSKAYGKIETEGVRPLYEHLFEAIYARGIETIVLTTHLHSVWQDDKPVLNKIKPGGRLTLLTRLSTLMLWLVSNVGNEDGAPAALVLKARMGKMIAGPDGWQTRRILPQRIPHFSWMDVNNYRQNPASFTNPTPGEIPTPSEQEMISEMLTSEQMRLMVAGAEIQLKQMQDTPMISRPPAPTEAILNLHRSGTSPAEIAQQLSVPLPLVLASIRN